MVEMVDISYQRRMAAEILKCGKDRVWIDPDQLDEVSEAVTRGDVRRLICYRVIQVRPKRGVSRGRTRQRLVQKSKGRRKGHGSRKGHKHARTPRKRAWIQTIRPIRDELKTLRKEGKLDPTTYRIHYRKARGNMYRNRADLLVRLEAAGVVSTGDAKEKESSRDKARREREERRVKAATARARVRKKAAEARAAREAAREAAAAKAEVKKEPEAVEESKVDEPSEDASAETPEKASKPEPDTSEVEEKADGDKEEE